MGKVDDLLKTTRSASSKRRSLGEADVVREQVAKLGTGAGADHERRIRGLLRDRRAADKPPLADLPPDDPNQGLGQLVYDGELVVRTALDRKDSRVAEVEAVLVGTGATVEPVPDCPQALADRLLLVKHAQHTPEELRQLAKRLTRAGFPASLNYVTPLGPVAKGLGGPEKTELRLDPKQDVGAQQLEDGSVLVAVIDNGVAEDLRGDGWLADSRIGRIRGVNTEPSPGQNEKLELAAGHGTFVAGIVEQVAPDCRIAMYRALDGDGVGSALDVARCVVQAALEDQALVLNLSLGTDTKDDEVPVALEAALEAVQAERPRTLVVAAAGNSGSTRPSYPAAFRQVVAVAGLTAGGGRARWSNHGPWVDCSAVAEGVLSTYVVGTEDVAVDPVSPDTFTDPSWALASGTSFAAPQVAGFVAQLCQQEKEAGREPNPHTLLGELLQSGTDRGDYGRGLTILNGTPL